MNKKSLLSSLSVILATIILIGCTPQSQRPSASAAVVITQTPDTTPQPSPFPAVESSIMPHDMTITPTSGILIPPIINSDNVTCLPFSKASPSKEGSILKTGSLLTRIPGEPGLWAISSKETLKKVYPLNETFSLSPDKKRLAFVDYEGDSQLHIFDLVTGDEQKLPLQEDWRGIIGWEDNNSIMFWLSEEKIDGKGRFAQSILLDLETGEAEVVDKEFDLPGYAYTYNNIPGRTFESHSPSNESLVLYTGYEGEGNDAKKIYMLRDTKQNLELWREEDVGDGHHIWPDWTDDGRNAALVLLRSPKRPYLEIIKLRQDGKEMESLARLDTLNDFADNFDINYIAWSPDANYIFFSILKSGDLLETGPGFILNIKTGSINEICEKGFIQGWWIPSNQLLYIVENEKKQRVLRILDVENWHTQTLLTTTEVFSGSDVTGWTPIEFQ